MNASDKIPLCPLDYALQQIGGKYKGRILWRLYLNEELRYNELLKMLPDGSAKMLTQALKDLIDDGIIIKNELREQRPKIVEYTLSDAGRELIPVMQFLKAWGDRQLVKKAMKID